VAMGCIEALLASVSICSMFFLPLVGPTQTILFPFYPFQKTCPAAFRSD
jgi:hypothetical protein